MNTEKITHFKKKLEAELKLVEGEMETVGRKNPDTPGDWEAEPKGDDASATEPDEKADKFEAFESDSSVLDTLEVRWRGIKLALEKIEKNSYGACEISGEEIEEERLEANPAARTCEKHMSQEKNLLQ